VPLDAWRALLNLSMGRQALEYVPDKDPAANNLHITGAKWEDVRQLEFLWHVLLGEPCVSPLTDASAYEKIAFDERPLLKAASRPAGVWHHVGCFSDVQGNGRVMGVQGELNYHGTHVKTTRGCQNMALDHGNDIAGMENDGECWACSGCDYARYGKLEACPPLGGPLQIQVFRFTPSVAGNAGSAFSNETLLLWAHMGCFSDAPARVIPTELRSLGGAHPADALECQALAAAGGYNTVGLANGEECWACSDCAYDALGEVVEGCPLRGGAWTVQVYIRARLLAPGKP
jgi:hypothetical protein